ncbi:MAG: tetratricopeptide repeat protein [Acidobacteriota bacterium]
MPQPDLSQMAEGVRQTIEAAQKAVGVMVAGGVEPGSLSEAFGDLGRLYLAHELMDASAVAFTNAGRLLPNDFRWPYYLGIVRQSRGELDQAVTLFSRVHALRPDDLAPLIRLGDVLLELNRSIEAVEHYNKALSLQPSTAAAHYGLGRAASAAGNHSAAVMAFEKALELQPEASIIHYPLGQAYRKLGKLDKAREHLAQRGSAEARFPDPLGSQVAWLAVGSAFSVVQALASEAEDFSERNFLGFVLSQLSDVQGAVGQLEEALRIQASEAEALTPDSPAAAKDRLTRGRLHYVIGGLLVHRQMDEAAREHFVAALELAPQLDDARIKLGNILAREGRFDDAVAAYSEVLARSPDNTAALLKRAAAHMSLEQHPQAVSDLEQLLALEPDNREARLRLARATERQGNDAAARQHFVAALELDLEIGERALTLYHLGDLERHAGNLEQAVARYEAAIALDPELADARFQLATTLGRQRRFDDAAQRYRELIELEPQHLLGRLGEATALSLIGRFADARDRLESGLMAVPGSLELTHTLARLLASCPQRDLRDGDRALELAQEVVAARSSLQHAETLAMAFAETGRFAEAIELQASLVTQAETKGDQRSLTRLRRHLGLYEAGEACCDS